MRHTLRAACCSHHTLMASIMHHTLRAACCSHHTLMAISWLSHGSGKSSSWPPAPSGCACWHRPRCPVHRQTGCSPTPGRRQVVTARGGQSAMHGVECAGVCVRCKDARGQGVVSRAAGKARGMGSGAVPAACTLARHGPYKGQQGVHAAATATFGTHMLCHAHLSNGCPS